MLYLINIYGCLQIRWVFPRGSCYESAKAIQSPHPRLKIIEQSWQILRHTRVCPRGYPPPPPRMAADKWIRKALYCGKPLNCSYNQWQNNFIIVERLSSNEETSENKTIHTPLLPIHSKLGCLLSSAGGSNSGTTWCGGNGGKESFILRFLCWQNIRGAL